MLYVAIKIKSMIKHWSERSGISVMRKYSKRAVALGLLVSMAVSVIPTQSFAAEAASKRQKSFCKAMAWNCKILYLLWQAGIFFFQYESGAFTGIRKSFQTAP